MARRPFSNNLCYVTYVLNVIHGLILGQLMDMAHTIAHKTGFTEKKLTITYKLELRALNSTQQITKFLQKT